MHVASYDVTFDDARYSPAGLSLCVFSSFALDLETAYVVATVMVHCV